MRKIPKSIRRILVTTFFITGVIAMQFQTGLIAFAATKTWTGAGGDNKFSTAANWSGGVPTNGDSLSFDVASLGADTALDNDIAGLSLTGMSFTGYNNEYRYSITGNALTLSGTLINTTTVDAGQALSADFIRVPVTLSGNINDQGVWLSDVNLQSYNLTLSGRNIDCNTYVEMGTVSGTGTITVATLGAFLTGNNSAFTGAVVINSGAMLSATVSGVAAASSITSNGGTLSFQGVTSSATLSAPLNLSGMLSPESGSGDNCRGSADPADPGTVLNFTGGLTLNGDLTYKSSQYPDEAVDSNVTAPFVSNGHTVTTDSSSVGTITIAPEDVKTVSDAPSNLVATPSDSQAVLNWDAPSSDGGAAITDYVVKYKLSSSGTWSTFADGSGTTTNTTVTGLTNGSDYDFQVAAVNSIGTSTYVTITGISVVADATTPDAVTAPNASVDTTSHNLVLNWTAPASDGGSAITDYLIEAKTSSSSTWNAVSHTPFTGTSFEIFSGLTDGETYDLRISPINAEGTGPSTTITNFLYTVGTGADGDIGDADGVGDTQTVTAPNTGISPLGKLQIKSPFAVIIFGLASVMALLFVAWPRRSN